MKRIPVIIAILFFSTSYAQDNHIFNIQKHIEKKIQEGKKPAYVGSVVITNCWGGPPLFSPSDFFGDKEPAYKNPISKVLFSSCWAIDATCYLLPNYILLPDRRMICIGQSDDRGCKPLYKLEANESSKVQIITADNIKSFITCK